MNSKDKVRKRYRHALSLLIFTCFSASFSFAHAQSTPTELADMTLEDLLDFEISELDVKENRWEFAYTYRKLSTGEYRSGTTDFSFQDVLFSPGETRTTSNFPVVPTFICQNVHALSAGYKLTDKVSLNVIIPYVSQGTDHISSVPGFADFLLKSKGVGDIGLSGSYQKRFSLQSAAHFNLGVRVPTGSIDKEGDTPRNGTGTLERLPYTMQIGSGTLDFTAAASYSRFVDMFKIGVNASTTLRTGKNDNDYRLGHNVGLSGWFQYGKVHWFQPGAKLNLRRIGRIKGVDTSLLVSAPIPYPASITDPGNYGGTKGHITATLKICPEKDCDFSLSGEYGVPIYQDLNGIQPKDRRHFSVSAAQTF